jgi:hypothetical protein
VTIRFILSTVSPYGQTGRRGIDRKAGGSKEPGKCD